MLTHYRAHLCTRTSFVFLILFPDDKYSSESPKGAFASHYVANHLRDVVSSLRPSSPANHHHEVNSTKNLANLSRLFRQLKPQPLHPESMNSKTKLKVLCTSTRYVLDVCESSYTEFIIRHLVFEHY